MAVSWDSAATMKSPAFTQAVVTAMRSLYPEELADQRWDNVGLLQDNIDPSDPLSRTAGNSVRHIVLLTNDLTLRVAAEAIRKNASVIVSYHPFIFRGLKSINMADPQQRIVLLLAQHNIAVYSPHTAVDSGPDGLAVWLASLAQSAPQAGVNVTSTVSVIQPVAPGVAPAGFENSGAGRLVTFSHPVAVRRLLNSYRQGLGINGKPLKHVMLARPHHPAGNDGMVRTVAVCAGSGADVIGESGADLLVTGEMTHHNALKAAMRGQTVLTFFHSNSERAYLSQRMQPALEGKLKAMVPDAQVLVSQEDKDPFEVMDVQEMFKDGDLAGGF